MESKVAIEEIRRLINKDIVKADDWDIRWDTIDNIIREYGLKFSLYTIL